MPVKKGIRILYICVAIHLHDPRDMSTSAFGAEAVSFA